MHLIAGHGFDPTSGVCSCGRKFSDISGAGLEHVGQEHWAHTGLLNTAEYYQILAEKERLWASLSGTSPIGPVPQPEDNSIFG